MRPYLPDYCTRPPSSGRDAPKPPSPTAIRFRRIALAVMLRGQERRKALGKKETTRQ